MKELSIEEKAKAYDNALKVANKYKDTHIMFPSIKKEMFPELAESEDERIRKTLLGYFKDQDTQYTFRGLTNQEVIAWLEKQGEHKSIDDVAKEVTKNEEIATSFLKYCGILNEKGELAEQYRQDEQKPVQEIEPTPIFRIGDILKRKGKDYTFIVDRIQGGYYHCDHNYGAFFPIEEQGNWELVGQKAVEWSKEDEQMIEDILDAIDNDIAASDYHDMENWLKSLRPQKQWKPSDEQLRL